MKLSGKSLEEGSRRVIDELGRQGGSGGLIAIDDQGNCKLLSTYMHRVFLMGNISHHADDADGWDVSRRYRSRRHRVDSYLQRRHSLVKLRQEAWSFGIYMEETSRNNCTRINWLPHIQM
jgi:hypothetical protein